MNEDKLKEKTIIWENMNRSDEKSREKTEKFYKNEIMPLVKKKFLQTYGRKEECEGLILTLGTSYEPIVLSICAMKPKKILILYTNETRELLDIVVELTGIRPSSYSSELIDSDSPLKLYRTIKEKYIEWGKPKNIYVDFTGGTKSMAAGCAMAGFIIDANLLYVGGDSNKTLRRPEPGSEKLYYIENPYEVFGDLDMQEAVRFFNNMDYKSAYRIFDELDQKVPDTRKFEPLKYLAKAYDSWDSLNLSDASDNMNKCVERLRNSSCMDDSGLISYFSVLEKQSDILKRLMDIHKGENDISAIFSCINLLIFNMYQNAVRREKQGRYEMASLLLYRILEIIMQKRLWNYGIYVSEPDYDKLKIEKNELLLKINDIRSKIKGFNSIEELDEKISLMEGYIILDVLGDDIIKTNGKTSGKDINLLNEMRAKVEVRNKSIFAHGFEFIPEDKYLSFKKLVDTYIDKFCIIENIDKEKSINEMKFIEL